MTNPDKGIFEAEAENSQLDGTAGPDSHHLMKHAKCLRRSKRNVFWNVLKRLKRIGNLAKPTCQKGNFGSNTWLPMRIWSGKAVSADGSLLTSSKQFYCYQFWFYPFNQLFILIQSDLHKCKRFRRVLKQGRKIQILKRYPLNMMLSWFAYWKKFYKFEVTGNDHLSHQILSQSRCRLANNVEPRIMIYHQIFQYDLFLCTSE